MKLNIVDLTNMDAACCSTHFFEHCKEDGVEIVPGTVYKWLWHGIDGDLPEAEALLLYDGTNLHTWKPSAVPYTERDGTEEPAEFVTVTEPEHLFKNPEDIPHDFIYQRIKEIKHEAARQIEWLMRWVPKKIAVEIRYEGTSTWEMPHFVKTLKEADDYVQNAFGDGDGLRLRDFVIRKDGKVIKRG